MAINEQELKQAEKRMESVRESGHAVSARYDRRRSRVVVVLNTGVELAFPNRLAKGLAGASHETWPISKSARPDSACTGLGWIPISMCRRCCKGYSARTVGWRANSVRKAVERAPSPRSRHRVRMAAKVDGQRSPPRRKISGAHDFLLPRFWALRNNIAYDAVYIALAEALDAVLLTRDHRLAGAAGHYARAELV